jgi:hypothetical protein
VLPFLYSVPLPSAKKFIKQKPNRCLIYSFLVLRTDYNRERLLKIDLVTELILGHGGLGEESNYDYSKLKRKGKERESNASYFTINTSVCVC